MKDAREILESTFNTIEKSLDNIRHVYLFTEPKKPITVRSIKWKLRRYNLSLFVKSNWEFNLKPFYRNKVEKVKYVDDDGLISITVYSI